MKIAQTIAATAILLLLLTWLWLRGMNAETYEAENALRALDRYSMAESALRRDVLHARAGMLRNYDPLVRQLNKLHEAVDQLRSATASDPEIAAASARLAGLLDQQEQWTERFKSHNSLLQNSLAYFGLFSTKLSGPDQDGALVQRVSALAIAMLHLTLDTSPAAAAEVDHRLDSMRAQTISARDSAVLSALLAHGRMLRRLLPGTDDVLRSLFAVPSERERQTVRAMVQARKNAAELSAKRFRYVLCAISLLLVGLLMYMGKRLQFRARSLRRRAAIEHVLATISTRFINSQAPETTAHVEKALRELGECIGADRTYFVITGSRARVYQWCREGLQFPSGWPECTVALASVVTRNAEGIIHICDVPGLPPGHDKDVLSTSGLHSWLCIPSSGGKCMVGVLGFDALNPGRMSTECEYGLLRMAFDALANAVDREFLERDRERLETNLQQARRMETVGALASGIAHNFNNIVGAILGYAETAQAQVPPLSKPAEHLGEIRRAGERARDLVDQILTFGRRANVRRSRTCMKALVVEARSLLDATLPNHVTVAIQESREALVVSGEAAQLQQVILNVCNNAAQAMDTKGTITIDLDVREIHQTQRLDHGGVSPGRYVVLSISDPGRGMSEATLERIFEPFFTTRLEGNGLGLATTREIVLEHGGALEVRSTVGAGTRFEMWLPSVDTAEPLQEHEPHGHADRGGGEAVLVLEADREHLLRDEEILAALGYEPVGFTYPHEAAAACLAEPTRFDAALLCFHSHGASSALEHAAALRASAPNLPIILATSFAREFGAPQLAAVGISEIIRQPLASAELAAALSRCLLQPVTTVTLRSPSEIAM